MKKLLISNIVTVIIVLGIIAAYSFSKPEQKGSTKYAVLVLDWYTQDNNKFGIFTNVDGKSEYASNLLDIKFGGKKHEETMLEMTNQLHQQISKIEEQGYQLVGCDAVSVGEKSQKIIRIYSFRKQ